MWVHIVIFVMILCVLTGWKKGWIPSSGIGGREGIRLFAAVAISGNLLGMVLTAGNGRQVYPQGYRLEKEASGSYEKEFMVSVDGEDQGTLYIQVPEKESEEQKGQEQSQELTQEEQDQHCAGCRLKNYIDRIGQEYDRINTFGKTSAYQIMKKYRNIVLCEECIYRSHEASMNIDRCRLSNALSGFLGNGDGCSSGKRKE